MSNLRKSIWDGLRRVTPRRLRPTGYVTHLAYVRTGGSVYSGPFVGMKYIRDSWFGGYIPKLLGVYERELHGAVEAAIAPNRDLVVDVGAAEGYYAVGLCRRLPQAKHIAFEMGEEARVMMAELAQSNSCQIDIRGESIPTSWKQPWPEATTRWQSSTWRATRKFWSIPRKFHRFAGR